MPKNLPNGDDDEIEELNLLNKQNIDDDVDNIEEENDNDEDYIGRQNDNTNQDGDPSIINDGKNEKKSKNLVTKSFKKDQKKIKNKSNKNISNSSLSNIVSTTTDDDEEESKFFVVRISGGQESLIASMLQTKLNSKKIDGIYSILFLENFKGYVIVEALDSNIVFDAMHGIRHIRGQIRGELPFKDLEGYLVKKPVVTELVVDDTVEIIAGPFKSMKAKIMRVDYEKQEATVVLLDSPYQIPVTVDANYLKKAASTS